MAVFPFDEFVSHVLTCYDVQADSVLDLYIKIAAYLRDNPIVSEKTVGEIVDKYLAENPITGNFYSPNNPPPYPVTSVNGKTGDVTVEAGGAALESATASLVENSGAPSVTLEATASTLDFTFYNLKGATGPQGPKGATGATGATGPQGQKGDAGKPGVYIGAESPSDSDVTVWVNPDGDSTFSAPNSDMLGGKAPEYYLNPINLLDNSNFSRVISQAGLNGSHGNTSYLSDRWVSYSISGADKGSYIRLTSALKSGRISQVVNVNAGARYTFAAKVRCADKFYLSVYDYGGATIETKSFNSGNGVFCVRFTVPAGTSLVEVRFYPSYADNGGSGDIFWAALYEGAYADSDVPPYIPKGYAAEMMECQRYYHIYATSAARPEHGLDCSPPMRIDVVDQGTVTVGGKTMYYNSADL